MDTAPPTLPSPTERLEFEASDGVTLRADRYASADAPASAPAIVMFTPYLRGQVIPPFLPLLPLVDAGYNVVVVDIRGTGESSGIFAGPLSSREAQDGAEWVEWIAGQPFCDGAVGLAGGSYPGAIQYLIAALRPAGLKAIAPGYAPVDFYRDWTHRGGIPSHSNWGAATFLSTGQPQASIRPALEFYYGEAQATPEDGPLFWERAPYRVFDQIEVPTLLIGGLYDYFGRGTVRAFDELDVPKRLVFGPWGHQYPDNPSELLRWFDYWLRGDGDNPADGENVRQWVIGADEWHETRGRRLPHAHHTLPVEVELIPVAESDRAWPMSASPSPVPFFMDTGTHSGMHLWGEATTVELDVSDVFIQGQVILDLALSAEGCDDADLHARLSLVQADGTVQQLTEGRLRVSHRELDPARTHSLPGGEPFATHPTHRSPRPLATDGFERVVIEFLPTSVAVNGSSRLRLGFSAVRNDGGASPGRLHVGPDSRILLPVLE